MEDNENANLESKKQEIESRGLSKGNPLKTPISSIMNKVFGGKSRKYSFSKLAPLLGLKFKLILIGVIIFIILIVTIVIVIGEDSSESAINSRSDTIDSLNIDENSSRIEQEALKLYDNYDSLIAFNDEQLNAMYQNLKDNENSTNKYLIEISKSKFGNSKSENDKYSYKYERDLYEHIQRTEKYNFNQIVWKEYSHESDGNLLEKEQNSELGLLVPRGTNEEILITLLDTTAPYLLTNDIPLGMLSGTYNLSSSGNYEDSVSANFVYELLKESLSKITVNKYVVESIKFNTSYDQYTTIEYTGTYTVKFKDGEVYLVSAPNYQQVGNPVEFVGEEHKISDDIISEDIYWYVESAETYDAKITNKFNYEKYSSEDVASIKNPDSNNLISSVEINRINGYKITDSLPEDIKVQVLNDALTKMFNGEEEDPDGGYTFTLTSTYTQDIGCTYTYEKEWMDTLTPSESNNSIYKYDDMVAYNTTEVSEEYKDIETDKKIIEEGKFKSGSIKYKEYEEPDTTVLYGLSIIDFIDSNEGIYLKYIASKNAAKSEFEGLGRYELKEGYNQIKYILNQLLKKSEENDQNQGNVLPFVYGSSLGYEVTDISIKSSVTSDYVSGMDLLRQYIFAHEGIGPSITQNSEGVDCYTAYDDGAGNITIGHGINLTGNPKYMNKLSEKYGDITVGTLVPVEEVESIENEMLKVYYDKAKEGTNGLDLKEYQIHALASFAYNYRNLNFSEFTRYYNDPNYWNEETDDRYEEVYEKYKDNQTAVSQIQAEANLNNKLYTDFFAPIVHDSEGKLQPGLVRRRKSEFILFSLGYYDNLQRFWSLGGSNLPGIELLNADGSINYDSVKELQIWYEQELFNGTTAPLNPQPNSIYKNSDNVTNGQRTNLDQAIKEEYRIYFNVTGTHSSSAYPKVIPVNEYFQCTWWAESMAYYFLYSSSGGEINGPIGKGNALGDGGQVASEMAEVYGVPTYRVNELEVGKHYVFSINGHVVYVEAVGNTEIVVSHCGSGTDWYGVSAVSRNSSQVNGTYVCMEDILATYGF